MIYTIPSENAPGPAEGDRGGRGYTPLAATRYDMTDDDLADAVERFLDGTDAALAEYDQGYVDADATVSVIRTHVDELRDAVDGE